MHARQSRLRHLSLSPSLRPTASHPLRISHLFACNVQGNAPPWLKHTICGPGGGQSRDLSQQVSDLHVQTLFKVADFCFPCCALRFPAITRASFTLTIHRPSTALGKYKPLLPVVVACAKEEDAVMVASIGEILLRGVSSDDAHTLAYRAQGLDVDISTTPIYCFREAKRDTGIYIGFNW